MSAPTAMHEAHVLLDKLRESRLSTEARRSSLEALRHALEPAAGSIFDASVSQSDATHHEATLVVVVKAIQDGPNDVRRVALQIIPSCIDKVEAAQIAQLNASPAVDELLDTIKTTLKSTLKIQSGRSAPALRSRPRIDIATLSISALRTAAAGLKALHSLLHITPRASTATQPSGSSIHPTGTIGLLDVLLPCLYAGLFPAGQVAEPAFRTSSGLRSGALSFMDQQKASSAGTSSSARAKAGIAAIAGSDSEADRYQVSSSGEADRRSDKSESERSDFSVASSRSAAACRSRKDESRQQDAMCKLIRQNALHCLVELNRRHANALVARWADLLPDQLAAPPMLAARMLGSAVGASRHNGAAASAGGMSLCNLMTDDPSTSVRLAAIAALESVLTHGALQLSMAQERAQRALSFTSLSSQLAGWIVNIRSYLVLALQRAAAAPRTLARAEGKGEASASSYPTTLVTALLRLSRTFAVSTARARLIVTNAALLTEPAAALVTHSDQDVQAAAKRLVATLAASKDSASASSPNRRKPAATTGLLSNGTQSAPPDATPVDVTLLLSQSGDLDSQLAERALGALETEPPSLAVWAAFVKRLAESPSPTLTPDGCSRLTPVWQRLSTTAGSGDQQCSLLASVADLFRALSRHAALATDTASGILSYVQTCSRDTDEAVRAAAVRVLGILVLPPETVPAPDEAGVQAARMLHAVLWGRDGVGERGGLLHDASGLVRQRAAWALSNGVEAQLRSDPGRDLALSEWVALARYCLTAGRDMEAVAVSACRTSGSLLAMLPAATDSDGLACELVDQLCRVLGAGGKPPKSRWNAASALSRALGSEAVLQRVVAQPPSERLDRIVDLLCLQLDAKVFKIRVSAAHALVALVAGTHTAPSSRRAVLGQQRCAHIESVARTRMTQLSDNHAAVMQTKEAGLYIDELQRLLQSLVSTLSTGP